MPPEGQKDTENQRGATLVEMAMVLPLLVLIIMGILEFGVAFKDFLTVSHASKEGSRVAAFAGDDPNTDCLVAQEVVGILGADPRIQRIEIYKTDANGNQLAGYTNTWKLVGDPADCEYGWTTVEQWPPVGRNVTVGGGTPLDIVGVRVILQRSWITGFPPFRGSYTVDEHTINRVEPEAFA